MDHIQGKLILRDSRIDPMTTNHASFTSMQKIIQFFFTYFINWPFK